MADDPDPQRPSFSSFWKASKRAVTGKNITFVPSTQSSSAISSHGDATSDVDAQERSKNRRAQVRRAQKEHRKRKANYTHQLEMDIVRLREMIEQTEEEGRELKVENDAFRERLSSLTPAPSANLFPEPVSTSTMAWLNAGPPVEYTFTCEMHDIMSTPSYQISSRTSSPSSGSASTGSGTHPLLLSPEQTDWAINFILALEHICWDHFSPSYYENRTDLGLPEHGHALMASHIALQKAPSTVFTQINQMQTETISKPQQTLTSPTTSDISWQASGLTLDSLRGLASRLNPPDKELTPVQAWFEIVEYCGLDVALDKRISDALKREFAGVVKCLHFGAVIERGAFDSIVGRVVQSFSSPQQDWAYA